MKRVGLFILLCSIAALFVLIPIVYSVIHFGDPEFASNFIGNWSATMIGTLLGIPIALAIYGWQQKLVLDSTKKEILDEERKRKRRILELLRRELSFNLEILNENKQPTESGQARMVFSESFKDELWRVFSDGGEIEWIKDNELLALLSDAYYRVRVLIYFESLYFQNRYFPTSLYGIKADANNEIIQILVAQDKRASQDIITAISKIDETLIK